MAERDLKGLAAAQEVQARRVVARDDFDPRDVSVVAGGDVTFLHVRRNPTVGLAAFVLLEFPSLRYLEEVVVQDEVSFPYIPGFLAFRELPLLLRAYERVKGRADLYLLDGQGIAHPRGLGIAAGFGVETGEVTVGCAKSRLYGSYEEPGPEAGAATDLVDREGRTIGAVLRPRAGRRLLFVSPGHRVGVFTALDLVRRCLVRHNIPDPIRLAHATLQVRRRELGGCPSS